MISIIIATDTNGGVGKDNDIPWLGKYPQDMKFFKNKTTNNVVVMGNNTWKSIKEQYRPLPDRINVVVAGTHDTQLHRGANTVILPHEKASVVNRIESLDVMHEDKEIFIIGGPKLIDSVMTVVDRLYITRIPETYDCDTFFDPDLSDFEQIEILPLCQDCDKPVDVYVYQRK